LHIFLTERCQIINFSTFTLIKLLSVLWHSKICTICTWLMYSTLFPNNLVIADANRNPPRIWLLHFAKVCVWMYGHILHQLQISVQVVGSLIDCTWVLNFIIHTTTYYLVHNIIIGDETYYFKSVISAQVLIKII